MKVKSKIKGFQLTVKVKLPSSAMIIQQELEAFSVRNFRGFMKPKSMKRSSVIYEGPVGSPLGLRLQREIGKSDFFYLIGQISDAARRLQAKGFRWDQVLWDMDCVFFNEATREACFLYLPVSEPAEPRGTIRDLVENIMYCTRPAPGPDMNFAVRFSGFLRTMQNFEPDRVDAYISQEDRSVYNLLKGVSSGFSGDISGQRPASAYPAQGYMPSSQTPYSGQGIPSSSQSAAGSQAMPASNYPDASNSGGISRNSKLSGSLAAGGPAAGGAGEVSTGFLNGQKEMETGVLQGSGEDLTGVLSGRNMVMHYPTLFRVRTRETLTIRKASFRIGAERLMDYQVTDNPAVSRNHAEISMTGPRYFIMDLHSTNGTFVNGRLLTPGIKTEISGGTRISLANEEFIFNA